MHPQKYQEICEEQNAIVDAAEAKMAKALEAAFSCPLPKNLRPATPDDIVVGRVIWYPSWETRQWAIVEEIRDPEDSFKAYSYDGSRHGLHGACVEIPEP